MGFFKKIGKGLKGLTKMVSLNNVKNVATGNYVGLSSELASRVKGGLVNEFTRKSTKPSKNLTAQNDALDLAMLSKQNPNIKQILLGALGGGMAGAGAVLSSANDLQNPQAEIADNVFMAWLKKNWLKALGIVTGVTLVGYFIVRVLKPKSKFKFGR